MWLAIYSNGFDGYELHAYDSYKEDAINSLFRAIQSLPIECQFWRDKKITKAFLKENASFHRVKLGDVLHSNSNYIIKGE